MKKSLSLRFIFFGMLAAAFSLCSSLVYALDFDSAANQLIDWIKDIFGPFFSALLGTGGFNEYLFERILLLILVYVIIFTILKKIEIFKNKNGVCVIISLIVSILGARYISEIQLIRGILLPYGVLTASLSIFLPFVIYFFFVHSTITSPAGRRIAWLIYASVFLGLWWTRYTKIESEISWVYWIGIGIVAIAFIFDDKIQEYFGLFEAQRARRIRIDEQIANVETEIAELRSNNNPSQAVLDTIERKEKHLKELRKQRRKWNY